MDLEKSMEDSKEVEVQRNGWLSVPAFGEWDQKQGGGVTDYSVDFTKIREMRKQHKRDPSRVSVGNEEELLTRRDDPPHHQPRSRPDRRSPTMRKGFMSYFNSCIGA